MDIDGSANIWGGILSKVITKFNPFWCNKIKNFISNIMYFRLNQSDHFEILLFFLPHFSRKDQYHKLPFSFFHLMHYICSPSLKFSSYLFFSSSKFSAYKISFSCLYWKTLQCLSSNIFIIFIILSRPVNFVDNEGSLSSCF